MRNIKVLLLLPVFAIFFTINAYAGTWIQDNKGWWYDQGNGTWPSNSWQWIDGNSDGTAECYYFDKFGYLLANLAQSRTYRLYRLLVSDLLHASKRRRRKQIAGVNFTPRKILRTQAHALLDLVRSAI